MRFLLLALFLTSITFGTTIGQDDIDMPLPRRTADAANTKLKARVYYEDTGRPVKRISVMLVTADDDGRQATGITDGNGMLEIKNVRAGKYYAIVNAPGVASPMAYLNSRRTNNDPAEVRAQLAAFPAIIVDGLTDITVEIPARRGGAIGGRVSYANGDPAIGVRVEVLRKTENEDYAPSIPNMSAVSAMMMGGVGSYQTDDRGVYRFSGLPAGEYIVKVTENVVHAKGERPDRGYEGFETMLLGNQSSMVSVFFDSVFEKEKARKLDLQLGQELYEINLVIPDRGLYALEGKVVAAKDKLPVRGARVSIKRDGDNDAGQTNQYLRSLQGVVTDDEGKWSFVELPKGKYIVSVESADAEFDEKDRAYGGSRKAMMRAANAAANAANAMVAVTNTPSNRGPNGAAVIPPPKFAPAKKEVVVEESDLTDQSIELSFGATISGTVLVEGTRDSPESVFIVAATDDEESASTSVSFYDGYANKSSTTPLKRDFRLSSISAGENYFNISITDKSFYVKSAASNQIDLLKGDVKFKEGDVFANVKIIVSNETGTLKGSVVDGDKRPVVGFQIQFVPTDSAKLRSSTYYRTARTDENGDFEIKLPPFEYAMFKFPASLEKGKVADFYAQLAEIVKAAQTVKIEAGRTSSVQLVSEKLVTSTKK